jgi:predicted hydrocarbon binding protein
LSHDLLRKFLAMKVFTMDGGSITLLERGMVLVPSEMLIKFYELMGEKVGDAEARRIMYEAGKHQTATGSVRYLAMKKELAAIFKSLPNTGDPSIEMGREVLKFTGMGDIRIVGIANGGGKIILSTANSPIALEHLKTRGKSQKPVCDYVRGVMGGVLESFYKRKFDSVEVGCMATGLCDGCTFEFTASGSS